MHLAASTIKPFTLRSPLTQSHCNGHDYMIGFKACNNKEQPYFRGRQNQLAKRVLQKVTIQWMTWLDYLTPARTPVAGWSWYTGFCLLLRSRFLHEEYECFLAPSLSKSKYIYIYIWIFLFLSQFTWRAVYMDFAVLVVYSYDQEVGR